MIEELTGCSHEEVVEAFNTNNEDLILTIDSLIQKPSVSGDKYIPPPPTIDTGLSDEQKERCLKGRDLQDKVNAVFSVAHSKIRTQPDPVALSDAEQQTVIGAGKPVVVEPAVQPSRQGTV